VLQQLEVHLLDPACVLAQHQFLTGFARPMVGEKAEPLPDEEAVLESPWLDEADRLGKVISIATTDTATLLPYLWHHPSVMR
jgi:hypothetical protein